MTSLTQWRRFFLFLYETVLHLILDVGFTEDAVQSCSGYSAENLAVIRHVGINLLLTGKKTQVGIIHLLSLAGVKTGFKNRMRFWELLSKTTLKLYLTIEPKRAGIFGEKVMQQGV